MRILWVLCGLAMGVGATMAFRATGRGADPKVSPVDWALAAAQLAGFAIAVLGAFLPAYY